MVSISKETWAETEARLRQLMPRAILKVFQSPYQWEDFPRTEFPQQVSKDALALVCDERTWSQLVPVNGRDTEAFRVFRFHFPAEDDNSGFIGWLASRLKSKFGTGVFVTCGFNAQAGGIYDYWGCPLDVAPAVLREIAELTRDWRLFSESGSPS